MIGVIQSFGNFIISHWIVVKRRMLMSILNGEANGFPMDFLCGSSDGETFSETRDSVNRVGNPLHGSIMDGSLKWIGRLIVKGSRRCAKYVPKLKWVKLFQCNSCRITICLLACRVAKRFAAGTKYLMILSEDEKYSNPFCLLHGDFTRLFSVAAVGNDLDFKKAAIKLMNTF